MAGDTQAIVGDTLKIQAQKVFQLPDGRLYGGSGQRQDVLAVLGWLTEGGEKPKVHEHFSGLVITATGQCIRLEDALVSMPIVERCHALGAGRDFALAAMALGQTAAEAVALAMQFDPWTGGEVMTLTLGSCEGMSGLHGRADVSADASLSEQERIVWLTRKDAHATRR